MNDFEDRLTGALRAAGDGAPDPAGLAPAARSRAAARRRRTALTTVAAVVAVAGVVGGVAALGGPGEDRLPSADGSTGQATTSSTPEPATDPTPTRVESWHDVSVQVPGDWGHGSLATWCLGGESSPGLPVVERPGATREAIGCDAPVNGYGLRFFDASLFDAAYAPGQLWRGDDLVYPRGAWLGYQRDREGDHGVLVVTADRATARAVLDSFEQIEGTDANGCGSRAPVGGIAVMAEPDPVRLCRYDGDGWLDQSELLLGDDARDAVAALDSAPTRPTNECPAPDPADPEASSFILVTHGESSARVQLHQCPGIFGWGDAERDLSAEALYWVLSPGWTGGVDGDVPMPEQLRR